ncbi:MAG: MOSC N-terminal beta barrel domain-containing protein [Actinomycetes bacterium]
MSPRSDPLPDDLAVAELWRHPVKSLRGERVEEAAVGPAGMVGDRAWAVQGRDGRIRSAKSDARLLEARAWTDAGAVRVELPDGTEGTAGDPALDVELSAWLGEPVRLVAAAEVERASFLMPADPVEGDDREVELVSPAGTFFDGAVLHLLARTVLARHAAGAGLPEGTWDVRRFRPNVVLAGGDDVDDLDGLLLGRDVTLGALPGRVHARTGRCVLTTHAQPAGGGLPALAVERDVLRHVRRVADGDLGVYLAPAARTTVRVGDPLTG